MNKTYLKAWHKPTRFFRGRPDFLELKQLADLEQEFRTHCRQTIRGYRSWRRRHEQINDPVAVHYYGLEGVLLLRQAQDAVRLYTIIRKDMRRSFRKYISASLNTKF